MTRLVVILLTITALSLGVAWIADEPGRVVVDWGNYHIETSLLVVLAGVAITALWCMVIYYVLYVIMFAPRMWLRSRLARQQQMGLEALTAAFAAIATQDTRSARRQIARAQQYLPHQPLTLMLASQVARLDGNEGQSRIYLEQMLKAESTEFMALRGLIENARRAHDDDAAIRHAEKALALKPQDSWLVTVLIGLYTKKQRTDDALRLIETAARKRVISKPEQKLFTAGVYYEYAKPLMEQRRFDLAIPALTRALRYQPGLSAASALLAESYLAERNISQALKVIHTAWKTVPHPLLTQALLKCFEFNDAHKKIIRMAEKMARMHPNNPETRFLLAGIALKKDSPDIARNEITSLIATHETVRACTTLAQIENASGDSTKSAYWMKRSLSSAPDPDFTCGNCHQPSEDWHLTCPHCGSVGTTVWK